MIEKENLISIGKNKGLKNKEHIEKNYFQDLFLFNLYKKTNIFVFKGGTALYKFYNLPRFSEDLNFSLPEKINSLKIEEIIKDVVNQNNIFSIKKIKKLKDAILIKIFCKGIITKYNILRLDIYKKNKVLNGFAIKNYIPDYIDISPFSLKILKPEEIIAEKIHSLFNRKSARDLYDLFFLLRQFKFNENLAKEKLKIFNMKFSKNKLKSRIKNLESLWKKELQPFVLEEPPEFNLVKNYVLKKLNLM